MNEMMGQEKWAMLAFFVLGFCLAWVLRGWLAVRSMDRRLDRMIKDFDYLERKWGQAIRGVAGAPIRAGDLITLRDGKLYPASARGSEDPPS